MKKKGKRTVRVGPFHTHAEALKAAAEAGRGARVVDDRLWWVEKEETDAPERDV